MNGIDLLVAEHEAVRSAFDELRADPTGPTAGRIFDLLVAHDDAETNVLYPLVEATLDADTAAEARDEHAQVRALLDVARQQEGAALLDTMRVLEAAVLAHAEAEEGELFPRLADAIGEDGLALLGAQLLRAHQRVG